MTRRGFTLIELLVVIAIIAILAAILFPVFAKVREKARQTSCLSNQKQLALSFIEYSEDYDETLPMGDKDSGVGWAQQIYPYVKSNGVFHCPDDTSSQGGLISYAFNPNMSPLKANAVLPISAYTSPSKTVLLTEVDTVGGFGLCGNDFLPSTPLTTAVDNQSPVANGLVTASAFGYTYNLNGTCAHYATGALSGESTTVYTNAPGDVPRHTNGANYALADGHVKWLMGTVVSAGNNAINGSNSQDTLNPTFTSGSAASTGYSGNGLFTSSPFAATYSVY